MRAREKCAHSIPTPDPEITRDANALCVTCRAYETLEVSNRFVRSVASVVQRAGVAAILAIDLQSVMTFRAGRR